MYMDAGFRQNRRRVSSKIGVKMNKSFSMLIYVKNVQCGEVFGCHTHCGRLQDSMKCVWTVWSCCFAISLGQHYVIASPNYESLESGSRSWVFNEVSHILIKFLPFPPFLIAAALSWYTNLLLRFFGSTSTRKISTGPWASFFGGKELSVNWCM